ncbi:hypothetical protein Psi01_29450 [Planobispora siamensis]|uniref:Uncharacterized protein n=1 Tax=Planobispora siamensis TaxID=936338 RepID=A0A8J3WK72_9ACTN|nr:hypothetical protein Psi01_29450 [Planobispora siamensis]
MTAAAEARVSPVAPAVPVVTAAAVKAVPPVPPQPPVMSPAVSSAAAQMNALNVCPPSHRSRRAVLSREKPRIG